MFDDASRIIAGLVVCLAPIAIAAAHFPAEIELADLEPANGGDGSVGVVIEGATLDDVKGSSVAGIGDVDNDGLPDFLIGGPGNGVCDRCAAYLIYGSADLGASIDVLTDPFVGGGAAGAVFKTLEAGDRGGVAVNRVGDLNADGIDDFVVGAPNGASAAGTAYIVFGRATRYPPILDGGLLSPANGGDGSDGFIVTGIGIPDATGVDASGGCDVNADGIDDVLIGTYNQSDSDPFLRRGKASIIFGRATAFPPEFPLLNLLPANGGDGSTGVIIDGIDEDDRLGFAVECAHDTNGDSIDDFLVSARSGDGAGGPESGEVYLVFGRAGPFPPIVEVSRLLPANGGDGSEGTILSGPTEGDGAGYSLAADDFNGDGLEDILIGAPDADPHGERTGRALVVFGRAEGFPAEFVLAQLLPENGGDGSEGFVLTGAEATNDTGWSVESAGDMNADGIADLVMGAPTTSGLPGSEAGRAYVYFGRAGGFPAEFELSSLLAANGGDGTQGFVLNGAREGDKAGEGVGGAGDVNDDGADDLLVGAKGARNQLSPDAGRAYVVYGLPALADGDGDGVPDSQDNCSAAVNADQRDTDGDAFGNVCDMDLNNDCVVNFLDLGDVKELFFTSDPDADFNGDGVVNFLDLGEVKENFFLPPGPSGLPNACDVT